MDGIRQNRWPNTAGVKTLQLVAVLIVLALLVTYASAQQTDPSSDVSPPQNDSSDAAATADDAAVDLSAEPTQNTSSSEAVPRNVETGLPLRSVISPLRWGHLSVLSLAALESYDTNYRMGRNATPVSVTSLQAMAVYSVRRQKSRLDLQYAPLAGFANNNGAHTVSVGHLVGLETSRHFGKHWIVGASDNFHYLPPMLPLTGTGFSPDFSSGTSSSTAFLTAGQKALINSFSTHLDYVSKSVGRLNFTGTYDFIRLSRGDNTQPFAPGNPQPLVPANGRKQSQAAGGGVNWTKQWTEKDTIGLHYRYEQQSYSGSTNRFNLFGLSYDRILKPTIRLGLQIGPAWSDSRSATTDSRQMTLYGSVGVFKSFSNGEAAFMFSRDNSFTGLLSDSFNNRYDLSYKRRMHHRWQIAAGASYVQQYYTNSHTNGGALAWGEMNYALNRSWALSTSYRYFNNNGAGEQFGRRQAVGVGIRWNWASDEISN